MIELYLSSDGKHTVHVAAQTPEEITALLPQARLLYETVVQTYGTKAQMWHRTRNGKPNGNGQKDAQARPDAPTCPIHGVPMAYRQGRRGPFWSCPTRDEDGTWCPCTVDAKETEDIHVEIVE